MEKIASKSAPLSLVLKVQSASRGNTGASASVAKVTPDRQTRESVAHQSRLKNVTKTLNVKRTKFVNKPPTEDEEGLVSQPATFSNVALELFVSLGTTWVVVSVPQVDFSREILTRKAARKSNVWRTPTVPTTNTATDCPTLAVVLAMEMFVEKTPSVLPRTTKEFANVHPRSSPHPHPRSSASETTRMRSVHLANAKPFALPTSNVSLAKLASQESASKAVLPTPTALDQPFAARISVKILALSLADPMLFVRSTMTGAPNVLALLDLPVFPPLNKAASVSPTHVTTCSARAKDSAATTVSACPTALPTPTAPVESNATMDGA